MFFKSEFSRIQQQQASNSDSYAFYTSEGKDTISKGHTTTFEYRKKSDSTALSTADFMMKPNNLQYFYEEKETSERVFKYHRRLHLVWKYTSILAFFVTSYAISVSVKQNHDMWEAAAQIV